MSKRWSGVLAKGCAAGGVLAVSLAACGTPGASSPGAPAASEATGGATTTGAPYKVALVYSKTGALAAYGAQYAASFKVGLDYATKGTNAVNAHPIEISEADDAGDPAKAVNAATTAIGGGAKIIAGSTASGVAVQVAPLAKDNKALFISGPAATDAVTGANRYTFRSGRQTYQDIATAGTMVGDISGKKVTVFAQDSTFGKANEAGVQAVLGAKGATVSSVLVPPAATDFTPFATQAKGQSANLVFVAWAGTNATQMWQTLSQQGVFDATKVVTGLDIAPTHALFGEAGDKISFLAHFLAGATDNAEYQALAAGLKKSGQDVDLFTNDGFVAAQMVVRALGEAGDDVDRMVNALEGWKFEGPKGAMEIRASDHALLQPMFTAKLTKSGSNFVPQLVSTLAPSDVAPPVAQMK